jgi:uncharacterized protein (TIRG00374 family)
MAQLISVTTVQKALKSISKSRILFAFKAVVAISVMAVLIKIIKPQAIYHALTQANKLAVALSFCLIIPNLYVQFKKWRFLVSLVKPNVESKEALKSLLVGFTLGFVTPGRVGEFGRAFFIKNCPWARVLGITIIDKLFSVSVIAIMGVVGLTIIWSGQVPLNILIQRLFLASVGFSLLLFLLLNPDRSAKFLLRTRLANSSHQKIRLLFSSLDDFHHKQARVLLSWCVIFYVTFSVQLFLLVLAFESISPMFAFAASSSAMFVKTLLPISLGDIGVRESTAVYFFSQIGINRAVAFNASFILFTINILFPSLLGLVILLRNRWNGSRTSNRKQDQC